MPFGKLAGSAGQEFSALNALSLSLSLSLSLLCGEFTIYLFTTPCPVALLSKSAAASIGACPAWESSQELETATAASNIRGGDGGNGVEAVMMERGCHQENSIVVPLSLFLSLSLSLRIHFRSHGLDTNYSSHEEEDDDGMNGGEALTAIGHFWEIVSSRSSKAKMHLALFRDELLATGLASSAAVEPSVSSVSPPPQIESISSHKTHLILSPSLFSRAQLTTTHTMQFILLPSARG